jgi:nicotinamidase-related amidase
MDTALLVIDVQNYFFKQGSGAFLAAAPKILPAINSVVRAAERLGWMTVATTHHAPSDLGNLMSAHWRRMPVGEECSLFEGLILPATALHQPKEYYSAFFRTDLEDILRQLGITRVVICGVMTHLCVDTTARHAFMLGFRPTVVSDACCSKLQEHHDGSLLALGHGFASIVTSDQWG